MASFARPASRRSVAKPLCHQVFDHLEIGFARALFFPFTPLLRTAHRSPRRGSLPAGDRPPFAGPPADPALSTHTSRLVPRLVSLRPTRGRIEPFLLHRSLPRPTTPRP